MPNSQKISLKDVVENVDLRTVSSRIDVIEEAERQVGGLKEGQVISFHNKAGTRIRHYQRIWGRTCLVIPPHDPMDKYSLFLKESQLLSKLAAMRKHQAHFEDLTKSTHAKKSRSDARRKSKLKG